tara:strand:- start:135 stop:362 length:228 start_codon:yes stop_codon:yes gene_type:complete
MNKENNNQKYLWEASISDLINELCSRTNDRGKAHFALSLGRSGSYSKIVLYGELNEGLGLNIQNKNLLRKLLDRI